MRVSTDWAWRPWMVSECVSEIGEARLTDHVVGIFCWLLGFLFSLHSLFWQYTAVTASAYDLSSIPCGVVVVLMRFRRSGEGPSRAAVGGNLCAKEG